MAGQNQGAAGPHPEQEAANAYEVKDLHRRLRDTFTDDELKRIPVLRAGARLEQGATYLDLRRPDAREFTARGDETAGPENWYVLKSSVGYAVWNRLLTVVGAGPPRSAPQSRQGS
jgi:hypothetical protein